MRHDPLMFGYGDGCPRATKSVLVVTWVGVLALRIAYIGGYRIDSDEPQHLHVVWSWVLGLVQYRDVFDNHAPLFHLLLTPYAAAVGERPDIVLYMRAAMLPLSAVALWSTYAIGRATFGRTVGAWAPLFAALAPGFFLASVEFRADTLWAALWLLGLAVLLAGPPTSRRAFAVGLLLGAALCTSLKTVVLLLALVSALVAAAHDERDARVAALLRAHACTAGLGFVLVPLLVLLLFAYDGALALMLHATVTHNIVGSVGLERSPLGRALGLAAAVPLWWGAGVWARRSTTDVGLGVKRRVLALTTVGYVTLLESCWPIATRQDFEPWIPLVAILATAAGVALLVRAARGWHAPSLLPPATSALGAAIVAGQILLLLIAVPPWRSPTRVDPQLLTDVLRLTRASDTIMDLKGETVFRERPFYYVLETLTRERLRTGSIPDTIPEQMMARRTCVALLDNERLPRRAREFLNANYLPVGRLRVAGRMLAPASAFRRSIVFDVPVAAPYAIVSGSTLAHGWLDARPFAGRAFLAAGRHRLRAAPSAAPLALIWAPALDRGFTPTLTNGTA